MKFLVATLFAASLAAGTGNALATTADLGTLSSSPTTINFLHNGSFSDSVGFQIGELSTLQAQLTNWYVTFGPITTLDIASLAADLYAGGNSTPLASYAWTSTVSNPPLQFSLSNLASGGYHLDISGQTSGVAGGGYSLSLLTTTVPEVSEWSLMMAGLLLLGFITVRRRVQLKA